MVKYIICATRKAGLSREEFSAYWRNHHGPLVRSVPEFARHVRKYVQCHLVGGEVPLGAAGSHDGVAELWFDSVEDLVRPSTSRAIWKSFGLTSRSSSMLPNASRLSQRKTL